MKIAKVGIFVGVAAFAIVGGSLSGLAFASAGQSPVAVPTAESVSVHPVKAFPVNEVGQTYGFVDQGLLDNPSARAQLVAVTTDEGVDGYSYFTELLPAASATNPDEAKALSSDAPYRVAVYELDGKTLLGFQTVNRTP